MTNLVVQPLLSLLLHAEVPLENAAKEAVRWVAKGVKVAKKTSESAMEQKAKEQANASNGGTRGDDHGGGGGGGGGGSCSEDDEVR